MSAVAVTDPAGLYWRSVVYIESTFPSGATFRGSGVMVGPNDVLTASHVLYIAEQGGAATSVKVVPAYDSSTYSTPYVEVISTSYHYYTDYDPDGDGLIIAGNSGAGLVGSELDIALIDLPTPVGDETGWMQLQPDFTSGAVNVTGYPAVYGLKLINDEGWATEAQGDSLLIYSGVELHAGNSGGPVWYVDGNGAHVVGVVSTASWGAAVLGVYDQLLYWIANNDPAIGGRGTNELGGGTQSGGSDGQNGSPPAVAGVNLNYVTGTPGDDVLQGTGRSDVFTPGAGNNQVLGGIGVDTTTFDGSRAAYTISYSNGSIVVTENATGTVNVLSGVEYLRFDDGMYLNKPAMTHVDFDGDGRSAVLLSNLANGVVGSWSVNGTMFGMGRSIATAPANWSIAGTGDFNGDGHGDILWRADDGTVGEWHMNGAALSRAGVVTNASTSWNIVGTGDFDADGRTDILWHSDDGTVGVWLMNGMSLQAAAVVAEAPANWRIVGNGDLDGDRRSDIVWQSDNGTVGWWKMDGTSLVRAEVIAELNTDWTVVGSGDFNGDHHADVLLRQDNGNVGVWLMNGGNIAAAAVVEQLPTNATIVGVGDFNADGRSDILSETIAGAVRLDLMDGLAVAASGTLASGIAADWIFTG